MLSQPFAQLGLDGTPGGPPPGLGVGQEPQGALTLPIRVVQELVESAVLANFRVIQASTALNRDRISLVPKELLTDAQAMRRALRGLAFDPDAKDAWQVLGVFPFLDPAPTELGIEQRAEIAMRLVQAAPCPAEALLERFESARLECLALLPQALRDRKRHGKDTLPRWLEVGTEARALLQNTGPAEERLATQLSSILAVDGGRPPRVLEPGPARGLCGRLWNEPEQGLRELLASPVCCWAPSDSSALGRLLATMMQQVTAGRALHPLRLLVPVPALPRCSSAGSILDLWTHPLLAEKWAAVVRSVQFTSQPLEIVLSAGVVPSCTAQVLMIATLAPGLSYKLPSTLSVALPLFVEEAGPAIRVDCKIHDMMQVRLAIRQVIPLLDIFWSDPLRSPGTTKEEPRVVFLAGFRPEDVAGPVLGRILMELRLTCGIEHTMFASDDIWHDNAAPLLELSAPAAFFAVSALCEQAVYVSPKVVTCRTLAPADAWESKLQELFQADPMCSISKLKWRPSRNGGRVIAQPAATRQQVRAAQRHASQGEPNLQSDIRVLGILGHRTRPTLEHLVARLAAGGLPLQEAADRGPLPPMHWRPMAAATSRAPAPGFQVRVSEESQLTTIRSLLHEKSIQLGADMLTITVESEVELARQAKKNGPRGARC